MKTVSINARITPELKADTENVLKQLGMSTTDAITIFFNQIVLNHGLPFEIKLPEYNPKTANAIAEAKEICREGKGFASIDDMFTELKK